MGNPFYNEGRYRCEMTNQGLGEASTGNAQIVWRFKVLETENGGQLPAQYDRTIYRTITENTMPYVIEDLKTLGFEHDSFKYLDPNQPGFQDFKGVIFTAFCKHEEDTKNGGSREKWGIANQGEFEVKPIESSKLRALDNLFGKQLKGFKKQGTPGLVSSPRASASAAPAAVDDDDVPF
jgi:hypothetical protein